VVAIKLSSKYGSPHVAVSIEAPPRTNASRPLPARAGTTAPTLAKPRMSDCPKPHLSIFLLKNKHLSTTRAEYCYLDPFQKITIGVFTSHANPKYFFFHSSHRIFGRMYGALNVGKKDN
jgi:hypothetical protein